MAVSDTERPTSQEYSDLERLLSLFLGIEQPVAGLARRPSPYASSFALEEVTVDLQDGRKLPLMRKDLGALTGAARRIKPQFLRNPMREIEAYRWIVAPSASGATFYGAIVEPSANRYVLYLEKIDGTALSANGDFGVWRETACWLAAFHARWSVGKQGLAAATSAHFLRYDRALFQRWLHRAHAFGRARGRAVTKELETVLRTYEDSIERLVRMEQSVIHGDFYASNILIRRSNARRVCPIDWELTALGPALIDLAALIAGHWTDAEKEDLALSYHSTLSSLMPTGLGRDSFLNDLDRCRLHVAIQWLGWSSEWIPPAEHAHDWLREAVRMAERLNAGK